MCNIFNLNGINVDEIYYIFYLSIYIIRSVFIVQVNPNSRIRPNKSANNDIFCTLFARRIFAESAYWIMPKKVGPAPPAKYLQLIFCKEFPLRSKQALNQRKELQKAVCEYLFAKWWLEVAKCGAVQCLPASRGLNF